MDQAISAGGSAKRRMRTESGAVERAPRPRDDHELLGARLQSRRDVHEESSQTAEAAKKTRLRRHGNNPNLCRCQDMGKPSRRQHQTLFRNIHQRCQTDRGLQNHGRAQMDDTRHLRRRKQPISNRRGRPQKPRPMVFARRPLQLRSRSLLSKMPRENVRHPCRSLRVSS